MRYLRYYVVLVNKKLQRKLIKNSCEQSDGKILADIIAKKHVTPKPFGAQSRIHRERYDFLGYLRVLKRSRLEAFVSLKPNGETFHAISSITCLSLL
ncbi:MAG: hypothetical protein JAY75_02125 [Candidatus Thiodiazotropha taylori]|nr:hypothetical protein [Candidatus Thiodiazotropha taylori]MCG8075023.1 hypothetical protein [Candidatus Thiodiazotropha taylori]MCW4307003.1 hypothetical protein [Candidatus Thiodiazotropha endolucinida]MCW4347263.1 hypothetical protein [Candidatus Thiodiazotropha endolucinida]